MNIATIILSSLISLTAPNNTSSVVPPINEHDSMAMIVHERVSAQAFEQYFRDFINIDDVVPIKGELPDSVYASRLAALFSPVEMAFNDIVKQRIVTYTTTQKGTISVILGRAQYYFPIIEQELDRAGLPLELRILPAIESSLQATARSHMGAAGLWQFMLTTGKNFGLEVTTLVDERLDPVLSTRAACKYLTYLYKRFGNWTLALAAYNCGEGNVSKAITKAGGKDKVTSFWDVYPYLPTETRGYVPAFIAVSYAFTYHRQHNITPKSSPLPIAVDTLMISRPLHLKQIEATLGTSMDVLTGLNPQYREGIIPAGARSYPLTLPIVDVPRYMASADAIHALDSVYLAAYFNPNNMSESVQEAVVSQTTHKVKSGDTLGAIARKYGVTVAQLKKWNNIKNANTLRIGQKLIIHK